ncbi:hypothetical protein PARMER_00879 [Parabacteroides merdae ATCC 43184]|nr:hypothetical protein PARMER_00879 [Parabacteroides merdae ATCC 43184]
MPISLCLPAVIEIVEDSRQNDYPELSVRQMLPDKIERFRQCFFSK